ncbi:hypothetical protein VPH35_110635 [Triticum aestivum]
MQPSTPTSSSSRFPQPPHPSLFLACVLVAAFPLASPPYLRRLHRLPQIYGRWEDTRKERTLLSPRHLGPLAAPGSGLGRRPVPARESSGGRGLVQRQMRAGSAMEGGSPAGTAGARRSCSRCGRGRSWKEARWTEQQEKGGGGGSGAPQGV